VGDTDLIYDFSHDKLRALVYEQTSLARRRLLHRRIADALSNARGRRAPGALAGQVAHHYRLAGLEAEAAEFSRLAGDHARALYAHAEALGHYRSALALGHPSAPVLHEAIGDLLTLLGEYSAAITSYETAAALANTTTVGQLEHKLGAVHHRRGEWDLAADYFRAALRALGEDNHRAERARIYADWSLTLHRAGEKEDGDVSPSALAEKALALAEETEDHRALAHAHNVLGILTSNRGDLAQAEEHLQRSLGLARMLGDTGAQAAALNNLALVRQAAGDLPAALELAAMALDLCIAQGDRHHEAALHNNLADLHHLAGQSEEAMQHLKQAVSIYVEIGVEAGTVQPKIWGLTEW
jgi:tetratricopeptide (TPR) repeat protein